MTQLWEIALRERTSYVARRQAIGARARMALQDLLARAGVAVSLVTIHAWSREEQGAAYLWAMRHLADLDVVVPTCVSRAVSS